MKASMNDVVALQVKCNRSTRETNCCSSSATRREVWLKENRERFAQALSCSGVNKTHASVARRLRFNPLLAELNPESFDKKMSLWASVGLCSNSITLLSLLRTYCNADCLLTRAELLISRSRSGKCDRRNGRTFGRRGKFVASWTAIWNSSIDNPPLCKGRKKLIENYHRHCCCLNLQPRIKLEIWVDRLHLRWYPDQTARALQGIFWFSTVAGCHEQTTSLPAKQRRLLVSLLVGAYRSQLATSCCVDSHSSF